MKKILKFFGIIVLIGIIGGAIAGGSGDSDKKDITSGSGDGGSDVTIEEQVLIDKNDVVITAKEYVDDSIWGQGIKLEIENKSSKDVIVGCDALIVNNYMITDLFSADVAAGKKSNETMYLSSSELEASGIDTVGQIEVYFKLVDPSTYASKVKFDCVTIKTSEFDKMDTKADDSGVELYNKNGVRIVGKAVDENSFWGMGILLYCENKSGKNIGISAEDVSVNGYMMDALFSTTVYKDKMVVDDITLFESDLEENGIESIDNVELKFKIFNAETYSTIDESSVVNFSTK